jgi:hypothetical protein
MDKRSAIQAAVWALLESNGMPTPIYAQRMVASHLYDAGSMRMFLSVVSDRLAVGNPPYAFDWMKLDIDRCLSDTILGLCNDISNVTTGEPGSDNLVDPVEQWPRKVR